MALITEDGTGKATAESYASVSEADTYLAMRSMTTWATLATADKEAALRRATDYMQQAYGQRWHGIRVNSTQALDWPRYDVEVFRYSVPSNSVPVPVVNACIELALRAAAGPLAPDVGRLKSRVKVGPLETEYLPGAPAVTTFRSVDAMVSPYLGGGSMSISIARA